MVKEHQNLSSKSLDLIKKKSTINLVIVAFAFAIALASVYFTRIIVDQLKEKGYGVFTDINQPEISQYSKVAALTANDNNKNDSSFAIIY